MSRKAAPFRNPECFIRKIWAWRFIIIRKYCFRLTLSTEHVWSANRTIARNSGKSRAPSWKESPAANNLFKYLSSKGCSLSDSSRMMPKYLQEVAEMENKYTIQKKWWVKIHQTKNKNKHGKKLQEFRKKIIQHGRFWKKTHNMNMRCGICLWILEPKSCIAMYLLVSNISKRLHTCLDWSPFLSRHHHVQRRHSGVWKRYVNDIYQPLDV